MSSTTSPHGWFSGRSTYARTRNTELNGIFLALPMPLLRCLSQTSRSTWSSILWSSSSGRCPVSGCGLKRLFKPGGISFAGCAEYRGPKLMFRSCKLFSLALIALWKLHTSDLDAASYIYTTPLGNALLFIDWIWKTAILKATYPSTCPMFNCCQSVLYTSQETMYNALN